MAPVSDLRGQSGLKQLKRTTERGEREGEGEGGRGKKSNTFSPSSYYEALPVSVLVFVFIIIPLL